MPDSNIDGLLYVSASEVLETMFFTSVLDHAEAMASGEEAISTRLNFHGDPSGSFGLSLPADAARSIAANFLGEEEADVPGAEVEEVMCELTNMICGSLLSRLESTATFELHHPTLSPPPDSCTFSRNLELDSGKLTAWLTISPAAQ